MAVNGENCLDPSLVADAVADAIGHASYYIPPQPDHIERIGIRMSRIVARRNPTLLVPQA